MLYQFWASGGSFGQDINGVTIALQDIVAWLDVAPASGPILIPDLVRDGWSNPSGGYEQVYAGDGVRSYAAIVAGEIPVVGARRVHNLWPSSPTWTQQTGNTISGPVDGVYTITFGAAGAVNTGVYNSLPYIQIVNSPFVIAGAEIRSLSSEVELQLADPALTEDEVRIITATTSWQRFQWNQKESGNTATPQVCGLWFRKTANTPANAQIEVRKIFLYSVLETETEASEYIDPSLPIGTIIANNTGTICAPGVAYFVTKNANTVDGNGVVTEGIGDRISGIDGVIVRGAATNLIDSSTAGLFGGTITSDQTLGVLTGYLFEGTTVLSNHRSRHSLSGLNNPHRLAGAFVFQPITGNPICQIRYPSAYANIDPADGSIGTISGMNVKASVLSSGNLFVEWQTTADVAATTGTVDIVAVTSKTSADNESHTTEMDFKAFGCTIAANSGGSNVPFPGIINNPSASTLLRQAMAPTIAKSAADLGTLGPELVTNGGFDADSDWVKPSDWSIAGGVASADGTGANSLLDQVRSFTSGVLYEVTFTVVSRVSGSVRSRLGNSAFGSSRSAPGTYTDHLVSDGNGHIYLQSFSFNGSIDNVSVKEIIPNHAFMVAYKQPSVWPSGINMLLQGDTANASLFQLSSTAAKFSYYTPSLAKNWAAQGETTAGENNFIVVANSGSFTKFVQNGSSVESAIASNPVFAHVKLGHGGGIYHPNIPIQQLLIVKRALTDAELQGVTS